MLFPKYYVYAMANYFLISIQKLLSPETGRGYVWRKLSLNRKKPPTQSAVYVLVDILNYIFFVKFFLISSFKMDEGFVKGQSDNLPAFSIFMVTEFIQKNKKYSLPECRGVKQMRSLFTFFYHNFLYYFDFKSF